MRAQAWACEAPECDAVAVGVGSPRPTLEALGWQARADKPLLCPSHHPAPSADYVAALQGGVSAMSAVGGLMSAAVPPSGRGPYEGPDLRAPLAAHGRTR